MSPYSNTPSIPLSSVCRSPKHSEQRILVVIQGAFERILHLCTSVLADGGRVMDEGNSASGKRQDGPLVSEGLRVLTLCSKRLPASAYDSVKSMT
jgi:magnesium-transporting ATPase (P-type)